MILVAAGLLVLSCLVLLMVAAGRASMERTLAEIRSLPEQPQ